MSILSTRHIVFSTLICITTLLESGRSPWRLDDPLTPEIRVRWSHDTNGHSLRDHCLEYHAIFCKFDKKIFEEYMLPQGPITYRKDYHTTVESSELARLAENVVTEIQAHKKVFTDFIVVKKSDFNPRIPSGLIILKYKNYPFILKLFLKTPESFVKLSEGLVPKFFFRMGGGTNRHLSGFTRIPNLKKIRERIQESSQWSLQVDTPRKWFWIPHDASWITIEGKNIGNKGPCETTIPAVYGIIADAIEAERQLSLVNHEDVQFGLTLSAYVGNRMDAHVDNLLLEKDTGKIVIIDTEHFPTMVGLKEPITFDSYHSWYLQLSGKCFKDNFMRHKKFRKEMQTHPKPELYPILTKSQESHGF